MEESAIHSGKVQRDLELVVQTGLLLAKNLDLHAIVQAATDAGLELCGAQIGAFFYSVLDAVGESRMVHAFSGVSPADSAQIPLPRDMAELARSFEDASIVRSADITEDPRYGLNLPFTEIPASHRPIRSYLAVPVKGQTGEVLGGLLYGHEAPDVFHQHGEDLVATVAAQAAIAIENIRLRERLTGNIRDLVETEARRREAMKRLGELAAIVESSDDAIISKDLTGRILTWNKAAARILGYTPDEIIGSSVLRLIPEDLHPEETVIIEKIRSGQRIEHSETIRLTKGGERLHVSLSISPVRDETGTIVGASKILRDVSDRRRMQESLLQAEKIAATGRMAATIAHEINNPLEAVINLLYLAKATATDPTAISYLTSAENEVVRVSHIARQTLGFYREHASAIRIPIADLAAEAIRVYSPKCHAAGITIMSHLDSTQQIVLRRGEITQVISNLIANAIYAMADGGTLTIDVKDTSAPCAGVVLTVQDTGIGIPSAQLSRIFEAFFTTRGSIGTGIGLFVAKDFIEGHGGSISVESSTDPASHGSVFSVFLPLENPHSRPGRAL